MSKKVIAGWILTGVWVLIWSLYLTANWDALTTRPFNEWGDFFAGISAPLAFLWLVIGYFQQGEELKQNTEALKKQDEALRLQVKELKQSVEQQKILAEAAKTESEINLKNYAAQVESEQKRNLPRLYMLDQPRVKQQENDRVFTFSLMNKGADISLVKFIPSETMIEAGIAIASKSDQADWPQKNQRTVSVWVKKEYFNNPRDRHITFSLEFTNLDGDRAMVEIKLIINDERTLTIYMEPQSYTVVE
ncbi:hypothetical protein [Aliikangiella coralliicola]|uniref:Uncharacterized protein n=1 Tax=Aliikangiella coralliicola TaxID=2592383 RepID=A0A545U047_9GAMM|nr:hypothetical protein [Aliikangiella coralliicola]TQV82842.1 hypothetical protein FLL46_24035 [Aliikangiella coralliicola]